MFKNMSLQARLTGAFMFIGTIVLIVALVGWGITALLHSHVISLSTNSLPSVVALYKINEGQTQIESSERALLDPKFSQAERQAEIDRVKNAWEQIEEGFSQYDSTPKTEEEQRIYKKLLTNWERWRQDHQTFMRLNQEFESLGVLNPFEVQLVLLLSGQQDSPEMTAAKNAGTIFNKLHQQVKANRTSFEAAAKLILEELKINEEVATATYKSALKKANQSTFWVAIGLILGPLTAYIFGLYFSNTVAKPLQTQVQQSGIQITSSTTQIAASGKELEAMVAEQVASTNEVVATAKEIAATSGQLVKTMEEVGEMSAATTTAAGRGQKDLTRMESTMRQLAEATGGISSKLGVISEKANNINSVVTTITKVADQTNLLSLNAAIEAEKAGEYGLGFAVVAREIRRLADQTAVATLDIETMVKDMQSAVSTGVMEMDKFTKEVARGVEDIRTIGAQMAQIIEQVQALTPRFEAVNQGMEAQSLGAMQISEAMLQISESSSQTAQALQKINAAIGQLNEAAQNLRREIMALK